jgi:GT2 family glycosyltransferase
VKFSLVTVTTDRLPLAERLFRSLAAQTHRDFEIIFAHGAGCSAEARALAGKFSGLDIKTLASGDNCLSRSRNLALPLACGDVVAFPDDDCLYEPDTLAEILSLFQRRPEADVLLASVRNLEGEDGHCPARGKDAPRPVGRYAMFRGSETFLQFHRRQCADAVGPFDESLGPGTGLPYGSGEDTDYVLRAAEAGFRVFRAPSALVRHPAPDLRDPGLRDKTLAYARGRMRLLRKHNMPQWFALANIVYPLLLIPVECLRARRPVAGYRWAMFAARLGACLRQRRGYDISIAPPCLRHHAGQEHGPAAPGNITGMNSIKYRSK